MQFRLRRALLALAAMLMLPACQAVAGQCERIVATGDPELPPYLWQDPENPGRLVGAAADLLDQLGKALGVRIDTIHTGAGPQAEADAESGRVDLLIGTTPNASRRQSLDFIEPAPFVLSSSVWVRRDQGFAYGGWNDLYGHSGVVLADGRLVREFDPLSGAYLPLQEASALPEALRTLQQGRADYLLHESLSTQAVAERLGMLGEVRAIEPPITSEGLYLAISRDSACNEPALRERLASGMAELVANGVPEQLLQRNLERWKAWQRAEPLNE